MYFELYSCRKGPTKIPLCTGTPQGNMKLFHVKTKVNTCTVCEIGLFTEEEGDIEQIGGLAISRMSL